MSDATTHISTQRPAVLADMIPSATADHAAVKVATNAALIVGGALFVALASRIQIPLGFTPIPLSLATFAVALTGGALGAARAVSSMSLYLALGIVGFPFFNEGANGWEYFTGATMGYLLGYVVLAGIVGWAAEQGGDRKVLTSVGAIVLGNLALYTIGTLWLAHAVGAPVLGGDGSGFAMGVRPFLVGDLLKMVAAGMLFPAAWAFFNSRNSTNS